MPPRPALSRGRGRPLIGRASDCSELDSLLEALRRGESRSLVLRGEAGGDAALPLTCFTKLRATLYYVHHVRHVRWLRWLIRTSPCPFLKRICGRRGYWPHAAAPPCPSFSPACSGKP